MASSIVAGVSLQVEQSLNRKLKNRYVQLGNGLYSIKNSGGDKAVISEGGDFAPIRALKGVHQNEAVVSFSNEKHARIFNFAVATRSG